MVRSFTKWDALPKTLPESLTALQEAYDRRSRRRWARHLSCSISSIKKKKPEIFRFRIHAPTFP